MNSWWINVHFSDNRILKWRLLNCKLTSVFRKQARLSTVERERVHMVARLTKISNSFSRYFRIAQEGSSVSGITSLYIRATPVVFLCGQIKPGSNLVVAYILCSIHYFFRNHALFYSILNAVLVLKLRAAHWCTRATISIQGQLYRYWYRQISATIHRRIDISNTALVLTLLINWSTLVKEHYQPAGTSSSTPTQMPFAKSVGPT